MISPGKPNYLNTPKAKKKKRQTKKCHNLQLKKKSTNKTQILNWLQKTVHLTHGVTQNRWKKILSDR